MGGRVRRVEDPVRTQQLAIDELIVLKGKGDENTFYAWRYHDRPDQCPFCLGINLKNQNLFSRTYADLIQLGDSIRVISLVYEFYKYRCLQKECRHIFASEISFASVNDNVTYRLEDKIAELVIGGSTYAAVSAAVEERISPQAVGQIFNRWTIRRAERRKVDAAPRVVGVVTSHSLNGEYTLIVSCDDGIRVLDVLSGIESARIAASLRRFCRGETSFVFTDCDPSAIEAAAEALPRAERFIPAEMWFRQVREEFREYSHVKLRWVQILGKEEAVLDPAPEEKWNLSTKLKRIFSAREDYEKPYDKYHDLESVLQARDVLWDIEELDEWVSDWPEELDETFREGMRTSLLLYREYRPSILSHQQHRDLIPQNLLQATDRLESLLRQRRAFSEQVLQAEVLFSLREDLDHWRGVRIENLNERLEQLHRQERKEDGYE